MIRPEATCRLNKLQTNWSDFPGDCFQGTSDQVAVHQEVIPAVYLDEILSGRHVAWGSVHNVYGLSTMFIQSTVHKNKNTKNPTGISLTYDRTAPNLWCDMTRASDGTAHSLTA